MLFSFLDINKTTTYLCLSFTDYSGFFPRRFGKEQDLLPSLFVSNQLRIIGLVPFAEKISRNAVPAKKQAEKDGL